jgi:hypothetical protein
VLVRTTIIEEPVLAVAREPLDEHCVRDLAVPFPASSGSKIGF